MKLFLPVVTVIVLQQDQTENMLYVIINMTTS